MMARIMRLLRKTRYRRPTARGGGCSGPSVTSHKSGRAPSRSGRMLVPSPAPTISVRPPSSIRPQA